MHGVSVDDERIERWLNVLRDGHEFEKIAARRGLAGEFEQREMFEEAIELLERNIDAGVKDAATLRWLSRLYQARGDEVSSLEAAVTASQPQMASPETEAPAAGEIQAEPTRPSIVRRLMPYVLMIVGLGIIVGIVLWMLTPVPTP